MAMDQQYTDAVKELEAVKAERDEYRQHLATIAEMTGNKSDLGATQLISLFAESVRTREMKGAKHPEQNEKNIHEYREVRSELMDQFHCALEELQRLKQENERLTKERDAAEYRLGRYSIAAVQEFSSDCAADTNEKLKQKLREVGVCPECLIVSVHQITEPFSSCACGTGEDHATRPLQKLQRLEELSLQNNWTV